MVPTGSGTVRIKFSPLPAGEGYLDFNFMSADFPCLAQSDTSSNCYLVYDPTFAVSGTSGSGSSGSSNSLAPGAIAGIVVGAVAAVALVALAAVAITKGKSRAGSSTHPEPGNEANPGAQIGNTAMY